MIDLNDALQHDPFAGDESYCTGLSDKIVKFRKTKPSGCQWCRRDIAAGTMGRAKSERNDESHTMVTWRWCTKCTSAMALPYDLDGEIAELRLDLDVAPFNPDNHRQAVVQIIEEFDEPPDDASGAGDDSEAVAVCDALREYLAIPESTKTVEVES